MRLLALLSILLLSFTPAQSADIWVDALVDDMDTANGNCDLREAITAANTDLAVDACPRGNGADRIMFKFSGSINLAGALPNITTDLTIIGPGRDLLTIVGVSTVRTLNVESDTGIEVIIADLTFQFGKGCISFGGASQDNVLELFNVRIMDAQTTLSGGGVFTSSGTLILKQVYLDRNTADDYGGAIYADGDVEIYESMIAYNSSEVYGGGIYATEGLKIFRSTISRNITTTAGGGIFFMAPDEVEIVSSSIVFNTVDGGSTVGFGGGIFFDGGCPQGMTIKNSILSDNDDFFAGDGVQPNIMEGGCTITSLGYNFVGNNEGGLSSFPDGNPNANNDYVGTGAAPLISNLDSTPTDEGGPTLVHKPNPMGSPVLVDQGSCSDDEYDQRGYTDVDGTQRIADFALIANADDACDIGAVELAASPRLIADLDISAFLDGPFNGTRMEVDLTSLGLVPTLQPYNVSPWTYPGIEESTLPSNMVDWVLVRLRSGSIDNLGNVKRRSYELLADGSMSEPRTFAKIRGLDPGYYFVELVHRNHLDVISNVPVRYEWGNPITHDFTARQSAYSNGGLAQRDENSTIRMWAGDGDVNGSISAFDFLTVWLPANGGPATYDLSDFNMDGSTTSFDFILGWLPANGQSVQY